MRSIRKLLYLIVFTGFSFVHAGSYDEFFQAVKVDDALTVKRLLVRGFDPNSVDPDGQYGLIWALKTASFHVLDVLIDNPATDVEVRTAQGESALMLAALKGNLEVCKKLIARDADVNKPGWTPLHYAATAAQLDVITLLLEHSAYIDAESPNGSTPLMMAAMYGNVLAVKLLLDAGADANLKNSIGLSAIDFALKADRKDSADLIAAAIRAAQPQGIW